MGILIPILAILCGTYIVISKMRHKQGQPPLTFGDFSDINSKSNSNKEVLQKLNEMNSRLDNLETIVTDSDFEHKNLKAKNTFDESSISADMLLKKIIELEKKLK